LRISRGASGEWMRFHAGLGTVFYHDGTERMRIDSSGNVGIGTTSPTGKLSVSDPTYLSSAATLGSSITLNSENTVSWTGTRELISFESVGNGADHRIGTLSIKLKKGASDTTLTEYMQINSVSNYTTFSTAATERMRIDSDGRANFNTTAALGTGVLQVKLAGTNKALGIRMRAEAAGNWGHAFENSSGTIIGNIVLNASSTSYNTTSDYRLKENVTDVTDGIIRVKQLNPKRFNFIADPDTTVDGFIAHEAQAVVPEAVTGTHNEVDDDGNAVMQGIDQSKLVPLLTAALQEAIAKIETLETEMTSVKARLDALEAE